jgi:hypothetical protein
MTGLLIVVVLVLAVGALVGLVLALRTGGSKPKFEALGAPPGSQTDPLIRTESRRHDTPAGADLDVHGGRDHGSPSS